LQIAPDRSKDAGAGAANLSIGVSLWLTGLESILSSGGDKGVTTGGGRRVAAWTWIGGLAVFAVVFALVAPASCGTIPDARGNGLLPICRSVTGIAYGGSTVADFLPALIFAFTAAIPAAFGARNAARRRTEVFSGNWGRTSGDETDVTRPG
jgi:hypothetical protein